MAAFVESADRPGAFELESPEPGALRIRLSGDWRALDRLPATDDVEARLTAGREIRRIAFDADAVSGWDSVLLTFLVRVVRAARARDITIEPGGLPPGTQQLLDLAFAVPEREAGRGGKKASWLSSLGGRVLDRLAGWREGVVFLGEATLALGRLATGRARFSPERKPLSAFVYSGAWGQAAGLAGD